MQMTVTTVADQIVPLIECVVDSRPGQAVLWHASAVGFQPAVEVIEYRLTELLTLDRLLLRCQLFYSVFDPIKLADFSNGYIGLADFLAFLLCRRCLDRLDKLSSCMTLMLSSA